MEMFVRGNVVALNKRGKKHYDKKFYRKIIQRDRLMIVISYYFKNNKKRYILRDALSDCIDQYFEHHLMLRYNNMYDARVELLGN